MPPRRRTKSSTAAVGCKRSHDLRPEIGSAGAESPALLYVAIQFSGGTRPVHTPRSVLWVVKAGDP